MMEDPSLSLFRQGAGAAFLLRFVGAAAMQDARYNRTLESLFQRQVGSTALQFMLSGGKTWSVTYGVNNPYSKAVVQSLLAQYPVGTVATPVARTNAGSASYHGTVNRARLNANGGGSISVQVTGGNVATGTITMSGRDLVFRAVAGPDGKFAGVTDAVPGEPGYRVDLQIVDAGLPAARVTGTVLSGPEVATLSARVSPWGTGNSAAAFAGSYNVRFNETPAVANAAVPAGPREARVQVLSSGVVNIVGQLAKGVPFSWSGRLAGDGSVAVHADIANRGSILGTISLKKGSGVTVAPSGSLVWQSPKTSTSSGFRQALAVQPR